MTVQPDAHLTTQDSDSSSGNPGQVEISPTAISRVVSEAVLHSYGIVGMASAGFASGIVATLSRDPTRGVQVRLLNDNRLAIDLHVIIEYGTRISTVAQSVIDAVRYDVERTVGVPVAQVNVHVQGLRVSDL
jgi:uncharacterized alkaline shock family protein YloU